MPSYVKKYFCSCLCDLICSSIYAASVKYNDVRIPSRITVHKNRGYNEQIN